MCEAKRWLRGIASRQKPCGTSARERNLGIMSVAELKNAVENLTEDERLELAEYLRWRARKDDPEWQAELARRVDRCVAGRGHSAEELSALHNRLS
jgi:hypothetical protein